MLGEGVHRGWADKPVRDIQLEQRTMRINKRWGIHKKGNVIDVAFLNF
jgi:hypothetical protein